MCPQEAHRDGLNVTAVEFRDDSLNALTIEFGFDLTFGVDPLLDTVG
jgi:hypothetical protein